MAYSINSDNPIITISILSSGRDDSIVRCLESLDSLRKNVPSELIITDTGCPDKIKAINESYTDIILPFTWCNDFSKARNEGLSRARGEWFIYLDDDEWFEDTGEIEKFFLSGKYKNYIAANYIQRNYNDITGSTYTDSLVTRCFKLQPDTRFSGIIHEAPTPLKGRVIDFNSFVHHYGYCFINEEQLKNHIDRNITLLKRMIEDEPGNIRWYTQILQEYRRAGNYSEIRSLCETGIESFAGMNDYETSVHRGTLYNGYIYSLIRLGEYQNALTLADKFIKDQRNTRLCNAALALSGAEAALCVDDYSKVCYFAEKYNILRNKLKNNPNEILNGGYFFVNDAFEVHNTNKLYSMWMASALMLDNPQPLQDYFDIVKWNDEKTDVPGGIIKIIVRYILTHKYNKTFSYVMETLLRSPHFKNITNLCVKEVNNELAQAERVKIQDEMGDLSLKLKGKIYELIDQDMHTEALSIISQLLSITPEDAELSQLKADLEHRNRC